MKIGNINVYGVIYKITNKINNKVYIGQTIEGFDRRYRKNFSKLHDGYLKKAILKYGIENFDICKTLDVAFSKEELNIKERHYIKLYNSNNKKYGYNLTEGGQNASSYQNKTKEEMDEIKLKLRASKLGKNNPMYGKNSWDYMDEDGKRKRIEKQIKSSSKPVICITTKRIFLNAKVASEYYSIGNSDIHKCCKGYKDKNNYKHKSAGKLPDGTKLVWRYLVWKHNKKYRIKGK